MIVNNIVVSYLLMSCLSLVVCVPASLVAWFTARSWKSDMTCEVQAQLEKKVYLVITLLSLAFFIRLFLIPLWFLTIQSLIPSIPGAMCMAGIHQLDTPISYIATILKFLIPLAYIYWLVLDGADRRIECQPYMKAKLMIVVPLALLMIAESILDIHFLIRVKPVIVNCCTSLFDTPNAGMLKLIRREGAAWISLFFAFFILTLVSQLVLRFATNRIVKWLSALSSVLALVFLVFALHTRVSPLMLEAPYHQCVFCLWQGVPDIAIASASVILGLWLAFVCSMLPDLRNFGRAKNFAGKLQLLAIILCVAGAVEIILRYVVKLFS